MIRMGAAVVWQKTRKIDCIYNYTLVMWDLETFIKYKVFFC